MAYITVQSIRSEDYSNAFRSPYFHECSLNAIIGHVRCHSHSPAEEFRPILLQKRPVYCLEEKGEEEKKFLREEKVK